MKYVVSTLLLAALWLSSPAAAEDLRAEAVCSVDLSKDDIFILEPSKKYLPDELLGVAYDDGVVYIYDHIARQVGGYACDRGELFRFGTTGTGPGDHSTYADPLFWNNEIPSIVDYGLPAKIIQLTPDGKYKNSFKLETTSELVRLIWAGDRALGVEISIDFDDRGEFVAVVSLVTFDAAGALIQRYELGRHSMAKDAGERPTTTALEIAPRVAYGDGWIYVQRDVYRMEVECMNLDFHRQWIYSEDLRLVPNQDYARLDQQSYVEPPEFLHPIRAMWARPAGTLWVELEDGDETHGSLRFRSIDANGRRGEDVTIIGLPSSRARMRFEDDLVLWSDINFDGAGSERAVHVLQIK